MGRFLQPSTRADPGAGARAGWRVAWRGLLEKEPEAAGRLALALQLVDRPSAWAGDTGELFALARAGSARGSGTLTSRTTLRPGRCR